MTASEEHVQVGIIGAGPAGLILAHLLQRAGITCKILESRSRQYCEERVRAGVLEQGTVDVLTATGLGERMRRDGIVHRGTTLRFDGASHHVDFEDLTGRAITIYGQAEVVKDAIAHLIDVEVPPQFETTAVAIEDLEADRVLIRSTNADGTAANLRCDFVAGCDGFHGVARKAIPAGALSTFEREYPFAWLGILAEAPPPHHELIYCSSERGFALFSCRTPALSRHYLQCSPDEDLSEWSHERIWDELEARLAGEDAPRLRRGPILQTGVTPMRSFVVEPMNHGRLFLAGDAAHIVPPTGAKGMNLAIADVVTLANAFAQFFHGGSRLALETYSETCLKRVWRAERFSWWMTSLLHRFPEATPFERRLQAAELEYVVSSRAALTSLAESYVGPPLDLGEPFLSPGRLRDVS
ncbi:MAG TPA: 4-hydroxybenzoate 3-monooxygenase [Candidatus Elarobacter sp.]|jgi:p-hydroxybenzoate 3-monooxygenase